MGRDLLAGLGPLRKPLPLLIGRAYEDNQTRQPALAFGWISVVPPRRIFSRFDKLDVMFLDFLHFALIVEALR